MLAPMRMRGCSMLGLKTGILSAGEYIANAVNFDGSSDYLTIATGLSGASDGRVGTFAMWMYTSANGWIFYSTGGGVTGLQVIITGGKLQVIGRNSSGTTILSVTSAATVNDGAWHHVAVSFDLDNSSNRAVYVDGSSDAATWATYTAADIDFTGSSGAVGADTSLANKFNGDMAEVFFDTTYIDLASNITKFVSNSLPATARYNGAQVTGSSPLLWLSRDTASWHTNKGTGGGYTENGALSTSSNLPITL